MATAHPFVCCEPVVQVRWLTSVTGVTDVMSKGPSRIQKVDLILIGT